MKIAIFTDTLFPEQANGVARVAANSAERLIERGHEILLLSPRNTPSVSFWGYPGERFVVPIGTAFREVKKFKPDVIHAHTPFSLGWEGLIAAKLLGIPIVGTHHTFFDHYLKHVHLDSALMRKFSWKYLVLHYNRYDLVLSPSNALLQGLEQEGLRTKNIFFPNGIDTNFFIPPSKPREKNSAHFVYMGRLSYEKSIDQVIRAFKFIHDARPDATLTIVGPGPERKKLEMLVQELQLEKNVTFTGPLFGREHLQALQLGDIFLTAAKTENMPLALIEAMAVGMPVIGVDALGIPEIVQNGKSGYIVPVDDPRAMAEKALSLLADHNLLEQFSQAARARALEYGEEKNAEALEKIYNSLLQ